MLPRFTFFGGKGGVGKTSCAAAAAVRAASVEGAGVLIVSTDPAHSLSDVLGLELGAEPRAVRGIVEGGGALYAAELDADKALKRWLNEREEAIRTIADRGTYLDEEDIDRFLSLAFPGVDELVGLIELMRLARSREGVGHVVVDTAPTGHTLRLLAMPDTLKRLSEVLDDMHEKHRFLASSLGGNWRPDFADETILEIANEAKNLREILSDERHASFTWVTLPEELPIRESEDGVRAIEELGVKVDPIVINRVWPTPDRPCALCTPRVNDEKVWRDRARAIFRGKRILEIPARIEGEVTGVAALSELGASVVHSQRVVGGRGGRRKVSVPPPPMMMRASASSLIEDAMTLRFQGAGSATIPKTARLVFFGGKGGVGKTTAAAATAIDLAEARRGERVLVLSTDPAHSLGDALDVDLSDDPRRLPNGPKNMFARELDAAKAWEVARERYRQSIDDLFSSIFSGKMDATFDRRVLEDLLDLAPPGIDELIAVVTMLDALIDSSLSTSTEQTQEGQKEERRAEQDEDDDDDDGEIAIDDLSDWENIPITGDDVTVSISVPEKPPKQGKKKKKTKTRAMAAKEPESKSKHAASAYDLVVVDTAPTGHTLRLLALPEKALEWVHALMSVILKYRSVIGLGELASDLTQLAKRLRGLIALLADPTQTAFVIVTRPATLPRLETERLARDLRHLKVPVSAIVANAVTEPSCSRCTAAAQIEEPELEKLEKLASRAARSPKLITAPAVYPGPRGVTALSLWRTTWRERR